MRVIGNRYIGAKVAWFLALLLMACSTHAGNYNIHLGKASDCEGFGICGVGTANFNGVQVAASLTTENGKHLQVLFQKSSVTDKVFLKYFATGSFLVEEDFVVPDEVCKQLNTTHCTIKAGKYKVYATADSYEVDF